MCSTHKKCKNFVFMVIPSTEKSFQSQSITSVERIGTAVLKEEGTRYGYLLSTQDSMTTCVRRKVGVCSVSAPGE